MSKPLKIAVSVGELSGDRHAARVIEALRSAGESTEVRGMGGRNLRASGADTVVDSEKFAGVMGFGDVARRIFSIRSALREMKTLLSSWRPDILLLVDYPDFNLRLAKFAKSLGIPVVYFIPPKIWAWRSSRIRKLARYTDHVAVIYPFEREYYLARDFRKISYVAHPFSDEPRLQSFPPDIRETLCRQNGLDASKPIVALFPGSRAGEVERHLSPMLEAITLLRKTHPDVQAVVSVAPTFSVDEMGKGEIPPGIVFVNRDASEILPACDAGILKSGTCNLEAAFCGLPFACFYKASALSAWIVSRFVKVKEFSPVNLIKSGSVRELLQDGATAESAAAELEALLFESRYRNEVSRSLLSVVQSLGTADSTRLFYGAKSAPERVARIVADVAHNPPEVVTVRSRVLAYLKPYTAQFCLALLCMITFGASDGVVPFLIKHILDKVFASQDTSLLYTVAIALVVFSVVRALADFGQQFLMSRIGHHIVRDLRNQINRHLLTLSPGYFVQQSTANLVSRITSDVTLVRNLLTDCVASILRDSVRVVTLLVAAIYLDPMLALIAVVVFPIGVLPVYRIGRKMRKLSRKGQEAIGGLSATLHESIMGNRVVKIFGREDFEIRRFEEANERLNRTFIKSEVARALTGPLNEVLASVTVSGVILYGGYSVINGLRSQGDFIAFLVAVFLLYDPFKKLSRVNATVQQGISGAERIFEILDAPPDIRDPEAPVPLSKSNALVFENVSFSYGANDQRALSNIALTIEEGKKIALVGFSGAGKSTLIDLLPRFIDPNEGRITLGGVDIRNVKLEELRGRFALVGQHTFLFNDTVYNNIAYGHPDASEEVVFRAAKAAYAYDFIMQLPQGFQTIVGESGLSLSGGERQRIAIARALLKDAPILILDEATASLDNRSEREVQSALEALEKGRTSLVIAHRLSTVRDADCILVMQGGEIVEMGRHDELLQKNGEYSRLYALQFRESDQGGDASGTVVQ